VTASNEQGFVHLFVPASGENTTLLLLHGTGGDENDLIPIGRELLPGAALLSPRGRVLENGAPRFFRRFAEGRFDLDDLKLQTGLLARFIQEAAGEYGFDAHKMIAVGYSNGANIAGSLILTEPDLLPAAVLFRPMVPFVPDSPPDLRKLSALLTAGRQDPIVTPEQTFRLAQILEHAGAHISIHWHKGGHELGQDDIDMAKSWILKWRAQTR
jgi:predicted esterase